MAGAPSDGRHRRGPRSRGRASRTRSHRHGSTGRHRLGAAAGGAAIRRPRSSLSPRPFSAAAASGVTAGQAAQLIAQGVREANVQLSRERTERQRWPRVGQLRIIELYLDRAGEAWRALKALAVASPALYPLTPSIETGIGPMRRPPDAGYRGADYDFISALIQRTRGSRGAGRLQRRHETCARRGPRPERAGSPHQQSGPQSVELGERRPANRPHAVQPACAGRPGGVHGQQRRDRPRARSRDGRDSMGTARQSHPRQW